MPKRSSETAKELAVGVAALLVLLTVAFLFVFGVVRVLGELQSQVAAALTAASATVITSVLAIVLSKRFERQARIAQEIRERKTPVYEELIATFFRHMYAEKAGRKKPSDRDLVRTFADLTPKLIVWGSEDVIKVWNRIRSHDWHNSSQAETFALWDDLLLTIRKDLGNKSDRLGNLDLLRLFINDFKEAGGDPDALPLRQEV